MKLDDKVYVAGAAVVISGGYLLMQWRKEAEVAAIKKKYKMTDKDYEIIEQLKKEKGVKGYPSDTELEALKKEYGE
jgi:uncharacterized membrane protein